MQVKNNKKKNLTIVAIALSFQTHSVHRCSKERKKLSVFSRFFIG